MAISFVGSGTATSASTSTTTYNMSNLLNAAGANPTLLEGDMVIVNITNASTVNRGAGALVPGGYTAAHTALYSDDSNDTNEQVSYKFMGSSPDTTITIPASNAATAGIVTIVHVFRGVDPATPLDGVAAATVTGINTAVPDPPSITPATAGAYIYIAAGGAMAAGAAYQSTAPTGLNSGTNSWRQNVLTTTTNDPGGAAGFKSDWASGAFNCPALTGGTSTNTGSWAAVALALRPLSGPTWSSSTTVNNLENTVLAHTMAATPGPVTYAIRTVAQDATSTDDTRFELSGTTLRWASNGTKDYETPNDSNTNNTYVVVVRATHTPTGLTADRTFTVTVTDAVTPTATDWSPAGTPSIPSSTFPNVFVKGLNKSKDLPLAVTGGTGASNFELLWGAVNWEVDTTFAFSGTPGTYTLDIEDTTNGPSGSEGSRTDTLSVIVTGGGGPTIPPMMVIIF